MTALTTGFFSIREGSRAPQVGDIPRIVSLGNVGPEVEWVPEDVTGTANVQAALSGFIAGSVMFSNGSGLAQDNANLFWDDTNNRLGIGTASPDEILHINNSGGNTTIVMERDTDVATQNSVVLWKNPGGNPKWEMGVSGTSVLLDDNDFYIAEDGTTTNTRFMIKVGGNVGIGTASPATSARLEISSTTGALLVSRMTTTQRDALTALDGMIIYNTTTATMQGRVAAAWVNL